jgi:hypothetical protein
MRDLNDAAVDFGEDGDASFVLASTVKYTEQKISLIFFKIKTAAYGV